MSGKREDLQAIRALAILSVLLFHFFPEFFPNGFVGVDQFFVLSGFLISLVLSRERTLDFKTIIDFYYRRVKRIFPLYLFFITAALVSLYFVFPSSNLESNLASALPALLFYTNVVAGTDENKEYNAMLQVAEDVFTHTWSLAVEIQFYFFVPFIFVCIYKAPSKKFIILFSLAFASLTYYCLVNEMLAFNSVFARMWQFSTGIICFFITQSSKVFTESSETLIPSEGKQSENRKSGDIVMLVLTTSFVALIMLEAEYMIPIPSNHIRISCTLITGMLIICGGQYASPLLTNRILVYIGDISYAVYLFHWPIVAYIKLVCSDMKGAYAVGLLSSLVIGAIISETFEKYYLRMPKKKIIRLVLFLYIVNAGILTFNTLHEAQYAVNLSMEKDSWAAYSPPDPRNMTLKERYDWGSRIVDADVPVMKSAKCDFEDNSKLYGVCHFRNMSSKGKYKTIAIGNSYTGTTSELLYDYCKEKFKSFAYKSLGSCEPLVTNSKQFSSFKNFIVEQKPDILFYIVRHFKTVEDPVNGTIDYLLEDMIGNLAYWQKHVKKRIFLFNAIPRPLRSAGKTINHLFKNGTNLTPDYNALFIDNRVDYKLARSRMEKLMKTCNKCELMDYLPLFERNGTFEFFDPITKFSFYTNAIHFTAPALERVKLYIKNFCKDFRLK